MKDGTERRAMLIGTVVGAVCGALAGVLFQRWQQQRGASGSRPVKPGQLVRLGMAVAVVVRQFTELFG